VPPAVASPEPPKLSEEDKDQIKHASNVAVPTTKATAVAPPEPVKVNEADKEQTKHAHNLVLATAKAAEAAVTAAQAAAEVVRLTANASRFAGKSKEELAAIKIQTTFRGYMVPFLLNSLGHCFMLGNDVVVPPIRLPGRHVHEQSFWNSYPTRNIVTPYLIKCKPPISNFLLSFFLSIFVFPNPPPPLL